VLEIERRGDFQEATHIVGFHFEGEEMTRNGGRGEREGAHLDGVLTEGGDFRFHFVDVGLDLFSVGRCFFFRFVVI